MKRKRTKGFLSLILALALMAALLPSSTLAGSIASEVTLSDAAALQEAGTSDACPVPGEDAYSDETERPDPAEGSDAYDANSGSGADVSGSASGADGADMTGSEDVSREQDEISGGDSSFTAEDSDTADGSAAEYADGADAAHPDDTDISAADGDAGDVPDESEIALLAADEDMPTTYNASVVYFDEQNNRIVTETLETVTLQTGSVEEALNADESLKSRTYDGKTYDLNWVYNADNLKVMEVTYAKNADGEWEVHYSFEEGAIGGQQVNTGLEIWYTARSEMLSVSYDPYPGSDETPLNYAEGSLGVKAGETLEFYVSVERGYTYTVNVTAGSETLSVKETTAKVKSAAEGEDTVYNTEGEFFIDIPEDTSDDIFVAVDYTQAETITFSPGVFADTTYPYLYDNGSRRFTMQENNGNTYSGGTSQEDLLKDYTVNYSEDGTTFTFAFSCGMGGTNWTGWLLDSLQINGVAVSIPGKLNTSATTTIVEDVSGDPDNDCTVTVSVDYMSGDLYYHTITVNNAKEDITITAANLKSSTWPEVIPTADAGIWFENDSLDSGGKSVTTGLNEPVTTSPNSISRIRFNFGLEKGYKNLTVKLDAYDAYKGILADFNAVSASDITGSYAFSFTLSDGTEATLATLMPGESGGYQMDFTIDNRQSTGVHMQYLYLSCEPELYNIAYYPGEGEGDIADSGTYSVRHHNANVTSDEPEAPEGHTFYGWAAEDPEGKDLSELTIYYPNDAVDFTSDAVWESVDRENPDSGFDGTLRFYAVYLDTLPEGTSGTALVNTYLQGITGDYQMVEGGGVEVAVTAGHSFTVYDSYIYSDNQNVINNGGYDRYTYFADASNPRIANATGMDDEIDLYYSLKFDGEISLDDWVYGEEKEAESDYLTVVDGDGNTLSGADNSEVGSAYVKSDYVYYMANEDGSKGGRLEGKPTNVGSYIVEVTWTLTLEALDANGDPVDVTDEITAEDPFEITPRPLTVTSGDAQKVYDGEPLTCDSYEITDGSLAYGDAITVTVTGSQTVVGSGPNTMSDTYAVTSSEGEDVSGNYKVTLVPGTLTVTAGSTDVTVTKVWDDGNDQDGIRPESVIIRLIADGEPALNADGAEIAAEVGVLDDWTVTFTDLPKYKVNTEIKYEITEDAIEGYEDTVIEGSASEGFTVTNIHIPETMNISGVKTWEDNDDQDGDRPGSITIRLIADGEPEYDRFGDPVVLTVTPDDSGIWSWSFMNLPKYDNGIEIAYAVTEDAVSGYSAVYDGYNVTNYHTPDQTSITVVKVWDDKGDQDGIRPESAEVQLYADGESVEGATLTLSEDNNWTGTFTGLDMYRDQGKAIEYTVREAYVPEGYEASVTGDAAAGYVVTNTHTPETTKVPVAKIWDDGDDRDGVRPDSITVYLYADGSPLVDDDNKAVKAYVDADGGWEWTFEDLPKYAKGEELEYSIVEEKVPDYDDPVTEGSSSEGFTITNSRTPETKEITVVKAWNDDDNRDGVRPDSAQVQLKADGEDIGEAVTLSSDNNWTYTWEDVWVYSGGEKITYSVEETSESEGYAPTYSSETDEDGSETFIVVNNHEGATTRITVNKVWQDNGDASGTRPESVTVQLLANGGAVGDPVMLNSSGGWSFTWDDLPAFENGTLIKYTVEEFEVEGYETETGSLIPIIEDSNVTGFGITVTNTRTADLAVTKEVSGTGTSDSYEFEISLTSLDGIRFNGEVTVSLSGGLEETLTFTDGKASVSLGDGETAVLHAVAYGTDCTVTEKTTGADSVTVYIDGEAASSVKGNGTEAAADVGTINGDKEVKFVNSYRGFFPIEEELVPDYTDRDTWVKEEGVGEYNAIEIEMSTKLPQVTGYDLENGSFTMNFHNILDRELVLDGDSADFLVFIGGEQISGEYYNVTTASGENPAKLKLYDSSASIDDGCTFHVDVDLSSLYRDGVITEEDLQGDTEIIIFFFADLEGTGLNGSYKSTVWYEIYDGDDLLYTSDEDYVEVYTYEIDIIKYDASTLNGTDYGASGLEGATLGVYYDEDCTDPFIRNGGPYTAVSGEDGRAVFYGLADGTYYVTEIEPPVGYVLSDKVLAVELGEDLNDTGYMYSGVFANTPETTDVSGSKTWDDADDQDGKRPESITVNLLADGEKIDSVTVTAGDGWEWSFTDLPKYRNGVEIVYTVTEDAVVDYTTVIDGYDITNSYTPGKTGLNVQKVWDDGDDQDAIRPESVTVELLRNGEKTGDTLTLDESNGWAGSFTDLDEYTGGVKNEYTAEEIPVDGYDTDVTDDGDTAVSIIKNTHIPETTEIAGSKTWDDMDDQDGVRPGSITISLLADGEPAGSVTVTARDGWSWSFTDLPKYRNGEEIVYSITEEEVPGYTTSYSGYDVINHYIPAAVSVPVEKKWDDDNNAAGARPSSVVVELLKNGESTGRVLILGEDNGWSGSFDNLDEYTAGTKNVYTVRELDVEGYTAEITGDAEFGYVITNTYSPDNGNPDTGNPNTGNPDDGNPDTQTGPGPVVENPSTGGTTGAKTADTNAPILYMLLIAAAGAVIVTLGVRRRRQIFS